MIELEGFLDVTVEFWINFVLHPQIVELKKLFLQSGLRAIVVSDQGTKGTRNEVER